MPVTLDMFEYANDAAAQAAYPSSDVGITWNWDLLDENCSGIGDWTDGDKAPGVSEVSPAGQFRHDTNLGAADDGYAYRRRILASPPNTFVIEIRTYHDSIGLRADNDKFYIYYSTANWQFNISFASDGLFVRKAGGVYEEVGTNIVKHGGAAAWQTWRFHVDKSGGEANATVEVFLDNVSQGTFDCDYQVGVIDGWIGMNQQGYTTNNMVTHIDFIRVATGGTPPPHLQDYSESGIKEQGDYSLKGIAQAATSLNDTLTRTVVPAVNLSDLTKNKFDIRASRTGSNIKVRIRDSGGIWTDITPNITSANAWQAVEWDISGVSNINKDAIDRIQIQIVNADVINTFYLDNMFGWMPVLVFTKKVGFVPSQVSELFGTELIKLGFVQSSVLGPLGLYCHLKLGFVPSQVSTVFGTQSSKLGLVPSHSSVVYGTLLKKLGLVPSHSSITYGTLLKKLGFVPSHISTIESSCLLKIGFVPSHTSITFGILLKKIGFVPIHEARVYKFSIELKFYDRDDDLVKIISSKTQNFPLINPGLEFEFLQDGGCGFFGFTVSENLSLDYNYKCEIFLWETKWFSGYVTQLPKIGTKTTYEYRGWGYFEQIDWQTIKETYTGNELSAIAEDILDTYIVPHTDVKKAA